MDFKDCLREQFSLHRGITPQDVVKQCYQAAYGAEHLLKDTEKARAFLLSEYNEVCADEAPLYESISPEICRVNLSAWKKAGLSVDALFDMFVKTARVCEDGREALIANLKAARAVIEETGRIPLSEFDAFTEKYREAGMPPVHHSTEYRLSEKPAYRIVNIRFLEEIL